MTISSKYYWIAFGAIGCSLILLVIGIVKWLAETPSDASHTWKIESTIYDLSFLMVNFWLGVGVGLYKFCVSMMGLTIDNGI